MIVAHLLLVALNTATVTPQQATSDFNTANEMALNGEHNNAVALYKSLISRGVLHQDVYYNLGYTLAASEQYVEALIAFESALILAPNDPAISSNIKNLREYIAPNNSYPEHSNVTVADAVKPWVSQLNLWAIGWFAILFEIIAICAILFYSQHKYARWALTPSLVICLTLFGCLGLSIVAKTNKTGLVKANISLLEGPHKKYVAIQKLIPGEKLTIIETNGQWKKVQRRDGTMGWVLQDNIVRLPYIPSNILINVPST